MTHRTRRRLALLVLVVGLPLYIVVAVSVIGLIGARWGRMPLWIEPVIFILGGFLWILPFRRLFRGVGRAESDESPSPPANESRAGD